jgi:hypothetical protein
LRTSFLFIFKLQSGRGGGGDRETENKAPSKLNLVVVKLPPRLLRAAARRPRAVLPVPRRPLLRGARREHRPDRQRERRRGQRRRVVAAVARGQDREADVAVGVDVRVDRHGGQEDDLDLEFCLFEGREGRARGGGERGRPALKPKW